MPLSAASLLPAGAGLCRAPQVLADTGGNGPVGLAVPGVWPAAQGMADPAAAVFPSGHAALDAVLAGGGWPLGGLVELLVAGPCADTGPLAAGLVGPAWWGGLRGLGPMPSGAGRLVLVDPPATPSVLAWQGHGLAPGQWVLVQAGDPARRLWACEQALACAEVGAVLVWLPHAPFQALRRLQLAATRHAGLLWVCRPIEARAQPSPAVLRLTVQAGCEPGWLAVQVFKQRGLAAPVAVQLPVADAWLGQLLAAAKWRRTDGAMAAAAPTDLIGGEVAEWWARPVGHKEAKADAAAEVAHEPPGRLLGRRAVPEPST